MTQRDDHLKRFKVANCLLKRLEELGIPISVILRQAGLPLGLLHQQRVLVSTEEDKLQSFFESNLK